MLSGYFDEYSLNARVRPSLLALLPPVFSLYLLFPSLYKEAVGMVGLVCVFGLITALSHFIRYRGKASERYLYAVWGGRPTTMMLRQSSVMIDRLTKQRYYAFFEKNIDRWATPSCELEKANPGEADIYYESAIKWLLEKTRDTKTYRLVFNENMSYGFRRNCYAIKWHAITLSVISFLLVGINIFFPDLLNTSVSLGFSLVVMTLSAVLFFWWLVLVNSRWVRDSADNYAIRLLSACDSLII